MIISKTEEYKKYLNYAHKNEIIYAKNNENIVDKLNELFENSYKNLKEINNLQNIQSLPSFSGRKENNTKLNRNRIELENYLKEIKQIMQNSLLKNRKLKCKKSLCCKYFSGNCQQVLFTNIFEQNVNQHFNKKYQALLLSYREIENKFLRKIKDIAIFDEIEMSIENKKDLKVKEEKQENEKVKFIRNSIFRINSMLHDLKMHLMAQDSDLDRIDLQLDSVNNNIQLTNEEVIKFKKRYKDGKDRLIICLLFICFALFLALIFKYERHNIMKFISEKNTNHAEKYEQPIQQIREPVFEEPIWIKNAASQKEIHRPNLLENKFIKNAEKSFNKFI